MSKYDGHGYSVPGGFVWVEGDEDAAYEEWRQREIDEENEHKAVATCSRCAGKGWKNGIRCAVCHGAGAIA